MRSLEELALLSVVKFVFGSKVKKPLRLGQELINESATPELWLKVMKAHKLTDMNLGYGAEILQRRFHQLYKERLTEFKYIQKMFDKSFMSEEGHRLKLKVEELASVVVMFDEKKFGEVCMFRSDRGLIVDVYRKHESDEEKDVLVDTSTVWEE